MKKLFTILLSLILSINAIAQCTGTQSTGTHNDCFINTSQQANINRLNVDSIIAAKWSVNALLSGSGSAFLEYSTNSGSSWITVNQVGKSLNLLTIAGSDDMNLTGMIPANALVRIRTTSSNMTITYTRGQEILY